MNIWGPSPYAQYDVSAGAGNFKGQNKTPGALSTSSQTTYEDDHYQYDWGGNRGISRRNTKENIEVSSGNTLLNRRRHALIDKKDQGREIEEHNSPLNTSGSSITEEIFNTALSNLEFLSDEEPTAAEDH
jgi:hypothetical protein